MFTDDDSLGDAKAWLHVEAKKGVKCPCCDQMVKVYWRPIHSTMARGLITLYRTAHRDYAHGPSLAGDTHELSQLSWWGLIEEEATTRKDGGRAGWWRITDLGEAFVQRTVVIPKYAVIYDSVCLGLEGDLVGIEDCLSKRFNYSDLMAGV